MRSAEAWNGPDDNWSAGDAYEAYMGRWSRPLAQTFIKWLRPKAGASWLEVGCGTGALTAAVCDLAKPASVVACDPSESFLAHARETLADPRVSYVVAGAESLPHGDEGFDYVGSGLVLNFIPDVAGVVTSIRERLRPGGVVGAYVWDYAGSMELLRCFWDEAIALDSGAEPLDEGRRFPLCNPRALAAPFQAAGFSQVGTAPLEITTEFASFEEYWTPFLHGTGPAPSYVSSLDQQRRDLLKERLRQRLCTRGDRPIHLKARAWVLQAVAN